MITPSEDQIVNSKSFGWEYLGDGYFSRGDELGWFTDDGFKKTLV